MTIRLGQNEAFELKRGDSTTSIPVDGDARIVTDIELDDVANAAQMKGWYPDGDVTDSSQWTPTWDGTDGLRYAVRFSGRFSSTSTDHTASVLPFCSSTYGEDNSHISGIVVIPPHADMSGERYSVTSIADGNPSGMQNRLTEVIMPSTLTRIGDNAFFGCISLSSVTIGDGVTSIGDGAFYGCLNLNGIEIPGSVTDIGSSAFYRCISLTAVTLPESVTSVGVSAFEGCADLASIVVEGRTQSQAATLLANASVPQGCTVTTYNIASQEWVKGQGFLTSVPSSYKTYSETTTSLSSDGYATQSWVEGKNYLSSVPNTYKTYSDTLTSLSSGGYATQGWVEGKNYLSSVPSTYKTYSDTLTSLSSDGYATQSYAVKNDGGIVKIKSISQAGYDALSGNVDTATLYVIPEEV